MQGTGNQVTVNDKRKTTEFLKKFPRRQSRGSVEPVNDGYHKWFLSVDEMSYNVVASLPSSSSGLCGST